MFADHAQDELDRGTACFVGGAAERVVRGRGLPARTTIHSKEVRVGDVADDHPGAHSFLAGLTVVNLHEIVVL
jgi:hypothetical protein